MIPVARALDAYTTALNASLDELGQLLCCPVCLSLPTSPVALKCNHYMCSACLDGVFKSASTANSVRCPTCRSTIKRREVRDDARFTSMVRAYQSVIACAMGARGDDECDVPFASQVPRDELAKRGIKAKRSRVSMGVVKEIRAKMPKIAGDRDAGDVDEKKDRKANKAQARGKEARATVGEASTSMAPPASRVTTVDGVRAAQSMVKDVVIAGVKNLPGPMGVVGDECAFCKRGAEIGERVTAFVESAGRGKSKTTMAHETCALWAPLTTESNGELVNVAKEAARSLKLKCAFCKKGGAPSGCSNPKCRKSYHIWCAFADEGVTFNEAGYSLTCAKHSEGLVLRDPMLALADAANDRRRYAAFQASTTSTVTESSYELIDTARLAPRFYITGSFLNENEKKLLRNFCEKHNCEHEPIVTERTTHVVLSKVDDKKCCAKKGEKYYQGILHGAWIVSTSWLRAGMNEPEPAPESEFEVQIDKQGFVGGPMRGRLRRGINGPLFANTHFVFAGHVPDVKRFEVTMAFVRTGGARVSQVSESDLVARRVAFDIAPGSKIILHVEEQGERRYVEHYIPYAKAIGAHAIVHDPFVSDCISQFKFSEVLEAYRIETLELRYAADPESQSFPSSPAPYVA